MRPLNVKHTSVSTILLGALALAAIFLLWQGWKPSTAPPAPLGGTIDARPDPGIRSQAMAQARERKQLARSGAVEELRRRPRPTASPAGAEAQPAAAAAEQDL